MDGPDLSEENCSLKILYYVLEFQIKGEINNTGHCSLHPAVSDETEFEIKMLKLLQ